LILKTGCGSHLPLNPWKKETELSAETLRGRDDDSNEFTEEKGGRVGDTGSIGAASGMILNSTGENECIPWVPSSFQIKRERGGGSHRKEGGFSRKKKRERVGPNQRGFRGKETNRAENFLGDGQMVS